MTPLESLLRQLTSQISGRIERDLPLAPLTTYRLGGRAAVYVEPAGEADLEVVARVLSEHVEVPCLPLGRGSNLVVSDRGFAGVVVHPAAPFGKLHSARPPQVTAGSAVTLPQLANWAARRGLSGLEFAVGIPGSVGGGVRMNAGAHGGEVADTLARVKVADLEVGETGILEAPALGLAYRRSNLSDRQLIVEAELRLEPADPAAVKERVDAYRRHRADTQPPAVLNAGSVFKNPPGDHAGRLVDAAGLKGFSIGAASVSELHANFFVAGPGASAQDVYDLVRAVRSRVHDSEGITLEPEIRFVGEFRSGAE